METLLTGVTVALVNAVPILIFGVVYRFGRRLDLSLDAQIASGGVVFAMILAASGSFPLGVVGGIAAATLVAMLLYTLTEWGRVPIEVGSLLTAFAVFKFLEFNVGESVSLTGVVGRLHPLLLREFGVPTYALSIGLLFLVIIGIEVWANSHFGLMYKAQGDNRALPLRRRGALVRGVVVITSSAVVGLAGVLAADRLGGVFSGFHLARVIDAFVVAELTMMGAERLRQKAGHSEEGRRPLLLAMANTPISIQLTGGAVVLGAISYSLIRFLHPALPTMIEALIVLLLMSRFDFRQRLLNPLNRKIDYPGVGFLAAKVSHSYREYGRAVHVLDNICLDIRELRGLKIIYGGNGVGKSTLLRILAGVEKPQEGRVLVRGESSRQHCRLISQEPARSIAPTLTVRENLELALGRKSKRGEGPHRLTDAEGKNILGRFTESEEILESLDRPAASLSGGQLQLLAVACASVDGSLVILADEPVKQLDRDHKRQVERELAELSEAKLVVISSHFPRLDLASQDDHYLLEDRKLLQGVILRESETSSLEAVHG